MLGMGVNVVMKLPIEMLRNSGFRPYLSIDASKDE